MLGSVSTWIALCGLISLGFLRADAKLRPEYRNLLSSWLRGQTPAAERWPAAVTSVFDQLLGSEQRRTILGVQLHLPAFWRAVLASFFAVVLTTSIWFYLLPETAELELAGEFTVDLWGLQLHVPTVIGYLDEQSIDGETVLFMGKQIIVMLILFPLISNFFTDYISFAETRFVLHKMSRPGANVPLLVLSDFLLSTLIILAAGYISIVLGSVMFGIDFGYSRESPSRYYLVDNILLPDLLLSFIAYFHVAPMLIEHHTYARQLSSIYGIFVYSTFLTSAWIWLFVLGRVLVRAVMVVPILFRQANKVFDLDELIDNRPLWLMGWVLIGAASAGFVITQLTL